MWPAGVVLVEGMASLTEPGRTSGDVAGLLGAWVAGEGWRKVGRAGEEEARMLGCCHIHPEVRLPCSSWAWFGGGQVRKLTLSDAVVGWT